MTTIASAIAALAARERWLLSLADNGVVHNHRLCEWCAQAPSLELDMALANIGLDHLGQARLWLAPVAARAGVSEDQFAFFRDEHEYQNLLLLEQPNGDFAFTVCKLFLYDQFHRLLLGALAATDDRDIADVAQKSLTEVAYHVKFSSHWMRVMVGGSDESIRRAREAADYLWPLCGEFFAPVDYEQTMHAELKIDAEAIKRDWLSATLPTLAPLGLALDAALPFYNPSGKARRHSEHLGYLLAEMQSLARRHPKATW